MQRQPLLPAVEHLQARTIIPCLHESFQVDHWHRSILESEYGYTIGENLFLGVVHPHLPTPRLIRVPYMQEEMLLIVEDQMRQRKAVSFAQPGPNAAFVLAPQFLDAN